MLKRILRNLVRNAVDWLEYEPEYSELEREIERLSRKAWENGEAPPGILLYVSEFGEHRVFAVNKEGIPRAIEYLTRAASTE